MVLLVENFNKHLVETTDNEFELVSMEHITKWSDFLAKFWTFGCIISALIVAVTPLISGNM